MQVVDHINPLILRSLSIKLTNEIIAVDPAKKTLITDIKNEFPSISQDERLREVDQFVILGHFAAKKNPKEISAWLKDKNISISEKEINGTIVKYSSLFKKYRSLQDGLVKTFLSEVSAPIFPKTTETINRIKEFSGVDDLKETILIAYFVADLKPNKIISWLQETDINVASEEIKELVKDFIINNQFNLTQTPSPLSDARLPNILEPYDVEKIRAILKSTPENEIEKETGMGLDAYAKEKYEEFKKHAKHFEEGGFNLLIARLISSRENVPDEVAVFRSFSGNPHKQSRLFKQMARSGLTAKVIIEIFPAYKYFKSTDEPKSVDLT